MLLFLLPGIGRSQADSVMVYLFLKTDCVISRQYVPALNRLYRQFASEKTRFIGLFPGTRDAEIEAFRQKYEIVFPLQSDYFQTLTRQLGATVTPEAVVYDAICNEILYKGRIDDMYVRVGKKRTVTTTAELEDALKAIQARQPVAVKKTQAVGCLINLGER